MGDIHAIVSTTTKLQFPQRLQGSLRKIVDRAPFRYGRPNEADIQRNRGILKRTLLSEKYRSGSISVPDAKAMDLDALLNEDPLLSRTLKVFNVSWAGRVPGHVCSGSECCSSPGACRDEVHCVLTGFGVLLSGAERMPPADGRCSVLSVSVRCLWPPDLSEQRYRSFRAGFWDHIGIE